jgi:hypothetical protein
VVERGEHARLAREAGAALRVGGQVQRQDLQRDVAPQLRIARAIHLAHATRAERCEDAVGPELAIDHRDAGRRHAGRRVFQERCRPRLVPEQRLDLRPQLVVSVARLPQEGVARLGRQARRLVIEARDQVP